MSKITIPGQKKSFRLYGKSGFCILDLIVLEEEEDPVSNKPILCRHPFEESKRALVVPSNVEALQDLFWSDGKITKNVPGITAIKDRVNASWKTLREDHRRYLNPTPYKVSVSEKLYDYVHKIWLQNAPIGQLE
ncbi:hypothetical protein KIN20_034840 [Parelaphostrongylus tenuis]|uniref:nicotinate phosphoribosyltransferase n=1 Tax=Parelaphostrongylus tenuis TaxID=148309 RepID=A0AAD5WKD1_PARTN|nr:hypothetical protein KIN20_034840 [Parelaphostrongylus tenuis]